MESENKVLLEAYENTFEVSICKKEMQDINTLRAGDADLRF